MDAKEAVLLSNIPGVLRDIDDPKSVIREINPLSGDVFQYVHPSKSKNGKGGLKSKLSVGKCMVEQGGVVHIANGRDENILQRILLEHKNPGTTLRRQ